MIFKNCWITTLQDQFLGYIETDLNGQIIKINSGKTNESGYDCQNRILLPGFIDSHTHGGYGLSFNDLEGDANQQKLKNYEQKLLQEGVIGVTPTTVTASLADLVSLIPIYDLLIHQKHLIKYFAWYIEGPFISVEKKGAHEANLIIPLEHDFLEALKTKFQKDEVIITVAPENKNNYAMIVKYAKNFIFSIGHSNDFQYAKELINQKNVSRITHLFNAMSGFFHNKKGIVNAVLETEKFIPEFVVEMITDGYHFTNEVIKFSYKNLDINHVAVISDSLPAKGLADGDYLLNKLAIVKKGNVFYLKDGSSLAGSAMPYNLVVKHFKEVTKCSWQEVVKVSSYNAAKNLNVHHQYGDIKLGMVANWVLIDDAFTVHTTIINGQVVYDRGK